MAQLERSPKSSEYSRSPRCQIPTPEHLQRDVFSGRSYDHDHEDHHKKSVLKKVKEKAKKLKRSLSGKKKHGMEHDDNTAPLPGTICEDTTEDNSTTSRGTIWEDAPEDNENPEFLGAPMYESEQAPETFKENSQQYPQANIMVPGKPTLPSCLKIEPGKEKSLSPKKMTAQSASDELVPKMEGLKITNPNEQETEVCSGGYISGHFANGSQKYDKGVSVKEYFMHKLEPGEDEKALSQVISDSLSPRKSPGKGVVDKFRRAVSSLIWHEKESQPKIKNINRSSSSASDGRKLENIEANFVTSPTSSLRNAMCNRSNPSPFHPVPTSTSEGVEEQNHGRTLQTN